MSEDSASHKWMVYVRSAPGSLSLDRHVSKVRFYLHPSYKPHDVITVTTPPFTLNRRGWGEFPMRIQLYFENPWNKTVDIIHSLKFGGTRSGLNSSRSTETFADLWIYPGSGSVESELSTEADASEILWMASNMMREVVPDFSTEFTCHKCQTISSSADFNCCPCVSEIASDHEDSITDNPIIFRSSQPICQDSDLTDSNDSFSNVKFLGSIDISSQVKQFNIDRRTNIKQESNLNMSSVEYSEIPVQKQIDTSNSMGFEVGHSPSVIINEVKKEKVSNDESYLNHTEIKCKSSIKVEPASQSNSAKVRNPDSMENNSQSGSLDFKLEPSDILDALEIKQELKDDEIGVFGVNTSINEMKSFSFKMSEPDEDTELGIIETEVVYNHSDMDSTELLHGDLLMSKTSDDNHITLTSESKNSDHLSCSSQNTLTMEEIPITDFIYDIIEEVVVEIPEAEQNSNGSHVENINPIPNNSINNPKPISTLNSTDCKNISRGVKSYSLNTKEVLNPVLNQCSTQTSSREKVLSTISYSTILEKFDHDINTLKGQDKNLSTSPMTLNIDDNFKTEKSIKTSKVNEKGGIITQKSLLLKPIVSNIDAKFKAVEAMELSKLKEKGSITTQNSVLLKPKTSILINSVENKVVSESGVKNFTTLNVVPQQTIVHSQSLLKPKPETNDKPVPSLQKAISLLKPALHRKPQKQIVMRNPLSLLKPTIISQNQMKASDQNHLSILRPEVKIGTTEKPLAKLKSPFILSSVQLVQDKSLSSLSKEKTNVIFENVGLKPEPKDCLVKSKVHINPHYIKTNKNVQIIKPSVGNLLNQSVQVVSLKNVNSVSSKGPQLFIQPKIVLESSNLPDFTTNMDCALKSNKKSLEKKLLLSDIIKILNISSECISLRTISEHLSAGDGGSSGLDLGSVLSSNILHCNFRETHKLIKPVYHLEKKIFTIVNKDNISSNTNKLVLYFLEQLRLLVNTCEFEDPEYSVRWLIRGLPLVHSDATMVSFKVVHPYCAPSLETYGSWPKTKRIANEWLRAKTVNRILTLLKAKGSSLKSVWTTCTIYKWCKTHGYSPGCTLEGSNESTSRAEDFIQRYYKKTPPVNVMKWMVSHNLKTNSQDQEIDVVGVEPNKRLLRRQENKRKEVDKGSVLLCGQAWVAGLSGLARREAERVDARLGLECLVPDGAPQALATTLLSILTATFAEDLLRRALSASYLRDGSCIALADVCQAICQRREFDLFTQQGLEVNSLPHDCLRKGATPKKNP